MHKKQLIINIRVLWIFFQLTYLLENTSVAALSINHSFQKPENVREIHSIVPVRNIVLTAEMMMSNISSRGGGGDVNNKEIITSQKTEWLNFLNPNHIQKIISNQFQLRIAADPDFVQRSIVEIIFAITMQFAAEVGRRGLYRILPEIDFVVAGLLTATAGKYYSMWRVAKTVHHRDDDANKERNSNLSSWRNSKVPTNAFGTLVDGTKPHFLHRVAAFFVPMPSLFQAGFIASLIGYGFTGFLVSLRTIMVPSYEAATVRVNIFHACLYTGAFMSIISNVRYQVLQGLIEPMIDKWFVNTPPVRKLLTLIVRLGNGLLGSYLAISGMKILGLQKLK